MKYEIRGHDAYGRPVTETVVMYRRKISSKRRWIARAKLGRFVPWTAVVEHESLRQRLVKMGCIYAFNRDGLILAGRHGGKHAFN